MTSFVGGIGCQFAKIMNKMQRRAARSKYCGKNDGMGVHWLFLQNSIGSKRLLIDILIEHLRIDLKENRLFCNR